MKSDQQIQHDVETELSWCPEIDSTDIAVKVREGVVTLSGYAWNFYEKSQAAAATKRIAGVVAVADDVMVHAPASHGLTDPEIARAAVDSLKAVLPQAWHAIQVSVEARHITLRGSVEWNYQRIQAENAVSRVPGVAAVTSEIGILTNLDPAEIREQIQRAFRRSAELDASDVSVHTHGPKVTLTGKVHSWAEHDAAERTAWAAPGVRDVQNELVVRS